MTTKATHQPALQLMATDTPDQPAAHFVAEDATSQSAAHTVATQAASTIAPTVQSADNYVAKASQPVKLSAAREPREATIQCHQNVPTTASTPAQ